MLEVFWYILSSVLAGVGTGLVGLSAATVMAPILIALCPSFAGNLEKASGYTEEAFKKMLQLQYKVCTSACT